MLCAPGNHRINGDYYVINPEGGYDRAEVLCCAECIQKPENKDLLARMTDALHPGS